MNRTVAARPERIPTDCFEEPPFFVVLPEGRIGAVTNGREGGSAVVYGRTSSDGSRGWGERRELLRLPPGRGGWSCAEALGDRQGKVHLFLLNDARTGVIDEGEAERPATGERLDHRLDVWRAVCGLDLRPATEPACIWTGYTGSLNSAVELAFDG